MTGADPGGPTDPVADAHHPPDSPLDLGWLPAAVVRRRRTGRVVTVLVALVAAVAVGGGLLLRTGALGSTDTRTIVAPLPAAGRHAPSAAASPSATSAGAARCQAEWTAAQDPSTPIAPPVIRPSVTRAPSPVPSTSLRPAPSPDPDEVATDTLTGPLAARMQWQGQVEPAVKALDAAGRTDPLFSALELDWAHRSLRIWRQTGRPDPRYTSVASRYRASVEFGAAVLNHAQASATMKAEMAAQADFQAAGVCLWSVSSDGHSPLQVGVDHVTPAATILARRHAPYGPDTVVVVDQGPMSDLVGIAPAPARTPAPGR